MCNLMEVNQPEDRNQINADNQNQPRPEPPPEPGILELPRDEEPGAGPAEDRNQPENQNPQELLEDRPNDQIHEGMLIAAGEVMGPEGNRGQAAQNDRERFDNLLQRIELEGDGEGEDPEGLKNKIGIWRTGNLYKAVLVAREVQDGGNNPIAAGRVSRFLNSSKWDTAADVNKIAGEGVGALTALTSNPTGKTVLQAASLITNFITMVTTGRNMIVKAQQLFDPARKDKTVLEKILLGLSIVGDAATMMVKAVNILKTIVALAGKNGRGAAIINKISSYMFILTGAAQLIGIANNIPGLVKGADKIKEMRAERDEKRNDAMTVVESHNGLAPGETASWDEERCVRAAADLYNRQELTEDEKDKLMMYIGLTKRVTKLENTEFTSAVGLLNLLIGVTSTGVTGANNIVNAGSTKNKTLQDAAKGMGITANISSITTTSINMGAKAASVPESGKEVMKNSLWEKVRRLTEDEYGLRGLYRALNADPGNQETRELAERTDALYEDTDKKLKTMGVTYGKLIKADSLDTFKNLLIEGLY